MTRVFNVSYGHLSPDLNTIENVWDALGDKLLVETILRRQRNKNTLIRALTKEWDKLPQQLLDNVVQRSFAMREKGGNHLVPGPGYMVDALKFPNQASRVSGESLQTVVAWRCLNGTQHLFCWPILAFSGQF
ncbi:hypothetical protein TNCV_1308581 [Trichonephila clavipes]|nr:hypothetical protein TNCV_1308581 [Trichonephila clavipes]